jgi:hypothetical protein
MATDYNRDTPPNPSRRTGLQVQASGLACGAFTGTRRLGLGGDGPPGLLRGSPPPLDAPDPCWRLDALNRVLGLQ